MKGDNGSYFEGMDTESAFTKYFSMLSSSSVESSVKALVKNDANPCPTASLKLSEGNKMKWKESKTEDVRSIALPLCLPKTKLSCHFSRPSQLNDGSTLETTLKDALNLKKQAEFRWLKGKQKPRPNTSDCSLRRTKSDFQSERIQNQVQLTEAIVKQSSASDQDEIHQDKNRGSSCPPPPSLLLSMDIIEKTAKTGINSADQVIIDKAMSVIKSYVLCGRGSYRGIVKELDWRLRELKRSHKKLQKMSTEQENTISNLREQLEKDRRTVEEATRVKALVEEKEEHLMQKIKNSRESLIASYDEIRKLERESDECMEELRHKEFELSDIQTLYDREKVSAATYQTQMRGYRDRMKILEEKLGHFLSENKSLMRENLLLKNQIKNGTANSAHQKELLVFHKESAKRHLEIPKISPAPVPAVQLVIPFTH